MKFVFKKSVYSFLKKDEQFEIRTKEDFKIFFEKCFDYLIKELENIKKN